MSERYPGGLIRKTPPTITPPVDGEGGSAPGIWTLEEVAANEKAGTWPKPPLPRELYGWGKNNGGQNGTNDIVYRSSPVQVGSLTEWRQIASGNASSLAIDSSGALYSWGVNTWGQLGLNDTVNRSSPVQVGALTNWASISMGTEATGAIKTDGSLWMWGVNSLGSLGLNDTITRSSPVQVGADTDWAQVCVQRGDNVVALKTDGSLWAIGGDPRWTGLSGTFGDNKSSPIQVGALTDWATLDDSGISGIAVIKTDGTYWIWGGNNNGDLGQNNTINTSSPVQVGALTNWSFGSKSIAAVIGITTSGELYTWGNNSNGQLGHNNRISKSSPTQVGALSNWARATSTQNFIAAIKTDGTLWTCGANNNGELAQNNIINRSSPVQVGSDTNWDKVSTGIETALGITKG